ncbi:MAG: hypothetical protein RL404_1807 [Pseudomonadota bacterium]
MAAGAQREAIVQRRLSLCADDFGQSAAINAGVLSLLASGRLQATSVLSEGPVWAEGAARLKALLSSTNPQADVGLHLNLTHPFEGAILARPLPHWLLSCTLRLASKHEVRDSFLRQVEAFVRHYDRLPDYLDGHQHVHAFPVVRDAVMEIIDQCWQGQTVRPWLRVPERLTGDDAAFKAFVLRASTRGFGALAESHGLRTTPAFGGLYSLQPDDGFEGRMKRWLRESPDGTLIMCHPGLTNREAPDASDPIAPARAVEYAYLSGEAFLDDCARSGVTLVRHSALLAAAGQ